MTLLALHCLLVCFAAQQVRANAFRNRLDLDSHSNAKLAWRFDTHKESIEFRITVNKRTALLGFGFSAYGEVQNADLIFVTKDPHSGRFHSLACWTDEQGVIFADPTSEFLLQHAEEHDGLLTVTVSRKFNTCSHHGYQIDRGTTHILFVSTTSWQVGKLPTGMLLSNLQPKVRMAQLIRSEIPLPELPSDTEVFDLTTNNIKLPNEVSLYWCHTVKLPHFESKRHIVKMTPIISPGNEDKVHHMEVFHCEFEAGAPFPDYHAPCNSEEKPKELHSCRKVLAAWAMGADGLTYPPEAGLPIGGPDFYPVVVLETHYNNPHKRDDVYDSSGIRFYVTRNLRPHDVGIMELGLDYSSKNSIPPRLPSFWLAGFCPHTCTHKALHQPISVFASQLHTHDRGRAVVTHHFRNGQQLADLNRDMHFSPHFQEIRLLPKVVTVKPGDVLITKCEYRTTEIGNVTLGGIAADQEMCLNYLQYYPKTDLELCKSAVSSQHLDRFFRFMHDWALDAVSPDKSVEENLNAIKWTPLSTYLLSQLYDNADLAISCNNSAGNRFTGRWDNVKQPAVHWSLPKKTTSEC